MRLLALIALVLTLGVDMAKAGARQAASPPDWNAIAAFYAGHPVNVNFPALKPGTDSGIWGTGQGGNVFNGEINLSPDVKSALDQWFARRNSRDGAVLGTLALSNLIHEALHTRAAQPGTGFTDWSNEQQAGALGLELVPDLMQRFFGVKIGSPVGKHYQEVSRALVNGRGIYR